MVRYCSITESAPLLDEDMKQKNTQYLFEMFSYCKSKKFLQQFTMYARVINGMVKYYIITTKKTHVTKSTHWLVSERTVSVLPSRNNLVIDDSYVIASRPPESL